MLRRRAGAVACGDRGSTPGSAGVHGPRAQHTRATADPTRGKPNPKAGTAARVRERRAAVAVPGLGSTAAGTGRALGLLKGASEVQDDAFDALADELSRRLRKTRAKLGESEANEFLLTGLNAAVRAAGRSQAAVPARARAFLAAVQAPHEDPDTGASVTIAERVEITAAQIATLQQKLDAFLDADTHQEGRKGGRIQLTEAKERKVRALDRWLAKWQQIAKADFTAAELATFGVPHNVHAARGRVRRRTSSSGPAPASGA
jgi:hypothetical protein